MGGDLAMSKIKKLEEITLELIKAHSLSEKVEILQNTDEFIKFSQRSSRLREIYREADTRKKVLIASILAIGEGPIVFRELEMTSFNLERFENLLSVLEEVENFYRDIGGIVGYHQTVLRLLHEQQGGSIQKDVSESYLKPVGFDLSNYGQTLNQYIRWGIENLPEMAEIYPVGGAGDRLDLRDELTGEALPAAALRFCGRTLLSLLIRDLQAKEYLYYKLVGDQVQTPVVMMTSEEKNNHKHIIDICESNNWFGRNENSFFLFTQPLVPVITFDGHWSMTGSMQLTLKPGGHGVIWKLAQDFGMFEWLAQRNRKKALLRQINNPIAGTDSGIVAFCGIGCKMDKNFGFSSCSRLLNTAVGMVVLIRKESNNVNEYCISNIEYTDFSKRGLEDTPEVPGSPYSKFPANTNILFVDIDAIADTLVHCPIPGMLVNFKNSAPYVDKNGVIHEVKAGRLESTMQNISDHIMDYSNHPLNDDELLTLQSYVTYNEKRKTISVTKAAFDPLKPPLDTPVGCFYEVLQNNYDLFSKYCGVRLPELCKEDLYIQDGPNLLILFHPALGPLYSVISQKISGGRMYDGAEMQLEIAEIAIQNIELKGSLIVEAEQPLGNLGKDKQIAYSELTGKCELKNVRVNNKGINRKGDNVYWGNVIERDETLHIILKGSAEFVAEDVTFDGDYMIEVPDGYRWTAVQQESRVVFKKEKISFPTWSWHYSFQKDDSILLEKKYTQTTSRI